MVNMSTIGVSMIGDRPESQLRAGRVRMILNASSCAIVLPNPEFFIDLPGPLPEALETLLLGEGFGEGHLGKQRPNLSLAVFRVSLLPASVHGLHDHIIGYLVVY